MTSKAITSEFHVNCEEYAEELRAYCIPVFRQIIDDMENGKWTPTKGYWNDTTAMHWIRNVRTDSPTWMRHDPMIKYGDGYTCEMIWKQYVKTDPPEWMKYIEVHKKIWSQLYDGVNLPEEITQYNSTSWDDYCKRKEFLLKHAKNDKTAVILHQCILAAEEFEESIYFTGDYTPPNPDAYQDCDFCDE